MLNHCRIAQNVCRVFSLYQHYQQDKTLALAGLENMEFQDFLPVLCFISIGLLSIFITATLLYLCDRRSRNMEQDSETWETDSEYNGETVKRAFTITVTLPDHSEKQSCNPS